MQPVATRMSEWIGRVLPAWRSWSRTRRIHAVLVFLLMLASVGHQLVFVYWYIEDAAISFSYAKHFAEGEGFVTYPGGERVEGFSDPLWVYLMVLFELVGIDGFTSSKIMGGVFGALCLPLAYLLAEEAFGAADEPDREPNHFSLVAPAFLAASAQFAIWNASGLENSLFCFLLAAGMWRTIVETRSGNWPTSALFFFGLAITRPEGILYAAFGGFLAMVYSVIDHRSPKHTMQWLVTFFAPFSGYQALRYSYFAWPFPNTYYAKLGNKDFAPFAWNARGWTYIRNWAHILWHGYLLPVYLTGLLGKKAGAKWSVLGAMVVLMGILLPGPHFVKGHWPFSLFSPPAGWNETRVWLLLLLCGLLFLRALGGVGWRTRVMVGGMAFISLFFSLASGGDWMKGFRWMSLLTVPTAVLFAVGAEQMAKLVGASTAVVWVPVVTALRVLARRGRLSHPQLLLWIRLVGATALIACVVGPNVVHSEWFARRPETGPFSVQKRVNYINWVEKRLHLLHQPTTFDVDMGANMFWSGNKIADVAGLVDVPMAHHNYQQPFMKEYIFGEVRPDFVHSHGGWASRTRIQTHPEWKESYFELPGYPTGKTGLHIGNWIRKDLFIEREWPLNDTSREVVYGSGIRITGFDTHLPVGAGEHLYMELGLKLDPLPEGKRGEDWEVRVVAFITNGERLHSWALPPGYDWYRPSDMKPGETFRGRFSLKVPSIFEPGSYELGLVVIGPEGAAPALLEVPDGAVHAGVEGFSAVFGTSEVRFVDAITVVSRKEAAAELTGRIEATRSMAADGLCEAAEAAWVEAQRRATKKTGAIAPHRAEIADALAGCYAGLAELTEDPDERTRLLIAAKEHDHHNEAYRALAVRHGELLYQDGHTARANVDWEEAYRLFSASVAVDPGRSWSRRFAEEARDFRLGIDPFTLAEEQKKRDEEADKRHKERMEALEARKRAREAAGVAPGTPPNDLPAIEGAEGEPTEGDPATDEAGEQGDGGPSDEPPARGFRNVRGLPQIPPQHIGPPKAPPEPPSEAPSDVEDAP